MKTTKENFNPKTQVMEYKRKCKECGKVWHSLENREKEIGKNINTNAWNVCGNMCNAGAQLQAKRNIEASETELDRLKKCPNCQSHNYTETVLVYDKK